MTLTTPKLQEYATKTLLLYSAQSNLNRCDERSHVNITKHGYISVVFNNGEALPTRATVRIGDFAKYSVFVTKLLLMLKEYTGKSYKEKDLNIY